jgi:hypothetical protein
LENTAMIETMVQGELLLTPRARWGGRRPGAGRKRSPRGGIPHLRRVAFPERHPSQVTLRVRAGLPSLRAARLVRELERSLREIRARHDFRVVHYSVQSNHVHLLVEAREATARGRGMKSVGARLARAVNRIFGRRGPVLADRYHAAFFARRARCGTPSPTCC